MKKIILIALFLIGCDSDTMYKTADGDSINVTAPGKVLVINYWAVWCSPCRKEIPELNELAAHHAKTNISAARAGLDPFSTACERECSDVCY